MYIKIIFLVVSLSMVLSFFSLSFPQKKVKDFSVSSIVVPRQIELSKDKANKIKNLGISKTFVYKQYYKFGELEKQSTLAFVYSYDQNGNLIGRDEIFYGKDGEMFSGQKRYSYNSNYQLVETLHLNTKDKYIYEFNTSGVLISEKKYIYSSGDYVIANYYTYVLDEFGDPKEKKIYNDDGSYLRSLPYYYYKSGSDYYVVDYTGYPYVGFNDIGDTIFIYEYRDPSRESENRVRYKYAKENRIKTKEGPGFYEVFDTNGNIVNSYRNGNYYNYSYDSLGILYSCVQVDKNKEPLANYYYINEQNNRDITRGIIGKWEVSKQSLKNTTINVESEIEFKDCAVYVKKVPNIYDQRFLIEKEGRWMITTDGLIKLLPTNKDGLTMYFEIGSNALTLKKIEDEGKIESSDANEIELIYRKN